MNQNNLREITREIVSGLIFSKDGKILLGKKDPNSGGVYTDCWHLPGGGTDEENLEKALRREIFEETGINIADAKVELIDNEGKGTSEKTLKDTNEKVLCHMNFNVYRIDLPLDSTNVNLVTTDDLVELKWFSLEDLKLIKLTPPSIELFNRLSF